MTFKFDFGNISDAPKPSSDVIDPPIQEVKEEQSEKDASGTSNSFNMVVLSSELSFRQSVATPPGSLAPPDKDLIPNVYEGGYKLWECCEDLVTYMHEELKEAFNGKTVLELGAGHAFPSIQAIRMGASKVDVNDFNVDVLRDVTIPNIRLNTEKTACEVRYFGGSWRHLPTLFRKTYDCVLSAETTYAESQCDGLAQCILDVLKDGGTAYVAGKSYYFGVGGGMRLFESCLKKYAGNRSVAFSTVKEVRDGASNVREIVQVSVR